MNIYLEEDLNDAVLGGVVPDEAGAVQGHVPTLRARVREVFGQQRGHFVLKEIK